jgi:hypothetical protein
MEKLRKMVKNMNRDFKGIWIPKEIWLNKDLSLQEKIFLVEIDSLDNESGCFASNEYFSDFFGLSKTRCSQVINSLKSKNIVEIEYQYNGKEIKKRILRVSNNLKGVSRKLDQGMKNPKGGMKKIVTGYEENCKDNNTVNNTVNNTKNESFKIIRDLFFKHNKDLYFNSKEGKQIKYLEKIYNKDKEKFITLFNKFIKIIKTSNQKYWKDVPIVPSMFNNRLNEVLAYNFKNENTNREDINKLYPNTVRNYG